MDFSTCDQLASVYKRSFFKGGSWAIIWHLYHPCLPSENQVRQITCFPASTHLQNADKLYKGHLSEFTPLASLHTLSKSNNQRRGSGNQRNAANSHRSQGFKKKTMFTHLQRTPDYCTFTPLLRFTNGPYYSKHGYPNNGAGPETSV